MSYVHAYAAREEGRKEGLREGRRLGLLAAARLALSVGERIYSENDGSVEDEFACDMRRSGTEYVARALRKRAARLKRP